MKRSEINATVREAKAAFKRHGWALPPNARWDITDFGLGNFRKCGLTLINLSEQREYCEKLMYCRRRQLTPHHYHASKKEDIICRWGRLALELVSRKKSVKLQVNGEFRDIPTGKTFILKAGDRITLTKGVEHAFWADTPYCIVGEVSTANDDKNDNFFRNKNVGRFSKIEEDAKPLVRLVSE